MYHYHPCALNLSKLQESPFHGGIVIRRDAWQHRIQIGMGVGSSSFPVGLSFEAHQESALLCLSWGTLGPWYVLKSLPMPLHHSCKLASTPSLLVYTSKVHRLVKTLLSLVINL